MINENITPNEVWNDGKTIHLYDDGMVGQYTAYGVSAFLLAQSIDVIPFFSDDAQMPAVIINEALMETMKKNCTVIISERNYYQLKVETELNEDAYSEWVDQVRI